MDERDVDVKEGRDLTRYMWAGVIVLVVVMTLALVLAQGGVKSFGSRVHAKHILVRANLNDPVDRGRALELITDIRARLEKGETFSDLARKYSDDTFSKERGGDLGWHDKGAFETAFEEYVWRAEVGALSDILQTSYGFHVVVVMDRNLSEADAYEEDLQRRLREGNTASPETPAS